MIKLVIPKVSISLVSFLVALSWVFSSQAIAQEHLNYEKVRYERQGFYLDSSRDRQFRTAAETCTDFAERAEYTLVDGSIVTFTAYPVQDDFLCEYFNTRDPRKRQTPLRFLCGWGERAMPQKANWRSGGLDAQGCFCWNGAVFDEGIQWCVGELKDNGCPEDNGRGNPCHVGTGNKYQQETDINYGPLRFTRSYNSQGMHDFGFGKGWSHNYAKRLLVSGFHPRFNLGSQVLKRSGSGKSETWWKSSNTWIAPSVTDYSKATDDDVEYAFTHRSGREEYYNADGLLVREVDTNGSSTALEYDQNRQLISVTDQYGQALNFTYQNDKLALVTDPLGQTYRYTYDDHQNLVEVTYPDTTPEDDEDNPKRRYFYEDTRHPNHLTGLEDENGARYATWAYDHRGRAILSEHSQTSNSTGQEKVELEFQWGQ